MPALRFLARTAAVLVAVCAVLLLSAGAALWISAGPPPALPAGFAVAPAAAPVSDPALRTDLLRRLELDQRVRSDSSMASLGDMTSPAALWSLGQTAVRMTRIDRPNQRRVRAVVAESGWPTAADVGADGMEALFYIVQHGPTDLQREALPGFRAAWHAGDLEGQHIALTTDRILANSGQPQVYGTQFGLVAAGRMGLVPIRDAAHVDARRAAMGMPPLAGYLRIICKETQVCAAPPAAS